MHFKLHSFVSSIFLAIAFLQLHVPFTNCYKISSVAEVYKALPAQPAEQQGAERQISFEPNEKGFIGIYGNGNTPERTRLNEGGQARSSLGEKSFPAGVKFDPENQTLSFVPGLERTNQVLRFELEGVAPRQICPGMTGPEVDGAYYCTNPSRGFCDRRSGICHCYDGYSGIDCSKCDSKHTEDGSGSCVPKVPCPSDCSGAGQCNLMTGVCSCEEHRTGVDCSKSTCSSIDPLCTMCSKSDRICVKCKVGFFVETVSGSCKPCTYYDPRCSECNSNRCLACSDLILNSVLRSGRRRLDANLPFDELLRQSSQRLEFGNQKPAFFSEAETFSSPLTETTPLYSHAVSCVNNIDTSWTCIPVEVSHVICGTFGTLSFDSPSYSIAEASQYVQVGISRTGGGYGHVVVSFRIKHVSSSYRDCSLRAHLTTSHELHFFPGVVHLSIPIQIFDNYELEDDRLFEVELFDARTYPTGQKVALGSQGVTRVKIVDDDYWLPSISTSFVEGDFSSLVAGTDFSFSVFMKTPTGLNITHDLNLRQEVVAGLFSSLENADVLLGALQPNAKTCVWDASTEALKCTLSVTSSKLSTVFVAILRRGGLRGLYFDDAFALHNTHIDTEAMVSRVDHTIDFVWGIGPIVAGIVDFVSIRWVGALIIDTDPGIVEFQLLADRQARVTIEGQMVIDGWSTTPSGVSATGSFQLEVGKYYSIVVDYCTLSGAAHVQLLWNHASHDFVVVPPENLVLVDFLTSSPIPSIVTAGPVSTQDTFASGACLTSAIAGEVCSFSLHLRDQHGNCHPDSSVDRFALNFALLSPSSDLNVLRSSAPNFRMENVQVDGCTFDVPIVPQAAGKQLIKIEFDGVEIKGSPYEVNILPAFPTGQHCDVSGDGYDATFSHVVGRTYFIDILLRDSFGNVFDLADVSEDISVTLTNQLAPYDIIRGIISPTTPSGSYRASFSVSRVGTYQLEPTIGCSRSTTKLPIACAMLGSGALKLNFIHSDLDPVQTVPFGDGIVAATSGIPSIFFIESRDSFGNRVQNPDIELAFDASLTYSNGYVDHFPSACFHAEAGIFNCSYTPSISSEQGHRAILTVTEVSTNQTIFSGYKLQVTISDGACHADRSVAFGDGTISTISGELSHILLQVKDFAGNNKSVPCSESVMFAINPIEALVDVKYTSSGVYDITYNLTIAGTTGLEVFVNGDPIYNSPLSVIVNPTTVDAVQSYMYGGGLWNGSCGETQEVLIQAVDRFGNNLTNKNAYFQVELFDSDSLLLNFVPDLMEGGLYDGSFIPTLAQTWSTSSLVLSVAEENGLDAEFFETPDHDPRRKGLERVDSKLAFDFSNPEDSAVFSKSRRVSWSARWTGLLKVPSAMVEIPGADVNGEVDLLFKVHSEGGRTRVWVGDSLLFDPVSPVGSSDKAGLSLSRSLQPGSLLPIRMDFAKYVENVDGKVSLSWFANPVSNLAFKNGWNSEQDILYQPIPSSALLRWREAFVSTPTYIPANSWPSSSYIVDPGLSNLKFVANMTTTFEIQVRDEFGNNQVHRSDVLTVLGWNQLKHGNPNDETDFEGMIVGDVVFSEKTHNGLYEVNITPTESGVYVLYVGLNLESYHEVHNSPTLMEDLFQNGLAGSPYVITIEPDVVSPSSSFVFGDNVASTVAGTSSFFFVQCLDRSGNKRIQSGDIVSISWFLEDNKTQTTPHLLEVSYAGDGLYRVDYNITQGGSCMVYVLLTTGVMNAFSIRVFPAEAYGPTSVATLSQGTLDQDVFKFEVQVQVKDRFGNLLGEGGENDFYVQLEVPDVFTAQNTLGIHGSIEPSELLRYQFSAPWSDSIRETIDHQNGTYSILIEVDQSLLGNGEKFEVNVALAHGKNTPNTIACSPSFPKVCIKENAARTTGGLLGEYFNTIGGPLERVPPVRVQIDSLMEYVWPGSLLDGRGGISASAYRLVDSSVDEAAVIWNGFIKAEFTSMYHFWAESYGEDLLLSWTIEGNQVNLQGGSIFLRGGRLYQTRIVANQRQSRAGLRLMWGVDSGANETLGRSIPGSVSVRRYSRRGYSTNNLTDLLGAGDEVELEGQRLRVEYYNSITFALTFTSEYMGESTDMGTLHLRFRASVIPSNYLFFGSSEVLGSPLIISTPVS